MEKEEDGEADEESNLTASPGVGNKPNKQPVDNQHFKCLLLFGGSGLAAGGEARTYLLHPEVAAGCNK